MALIFVTAAVPASAVSGRYACMPKQHQLVLDFSANKLTLDGATDALTPGAVTWRGKPGGHTVVVAPGENGAKSVFDVSIDAGSDYSGFVVCRRL